MDSATLELRDKARIRQAEMLKQQKTRISQAEMLKQWRRGIGLSQKDVARLSGMSQAYISQVENGLMEIGGALKTFLEGVARRRDRHFPVH
ncbi:hypothetical protein ES702_03198 [subsurface metagenome]